MNTTDRFQKRSGGSPEWLAGVVVVLLGGFDLWAVGYIIVKCWQIWGR